MWCAAGCNCLALVVNCCLHGAAADGWPKPGCWCKADVRVGLCVSFTSSAFPEAVTRETLPLPRNIGDTHTYMQHTHSGYSRTAFALADFTLADAKPNSYSSLVCCLYVVYFENPTDYKSLILISNVYLFYISAIWGFKLACNIHNIPNS